MCEIDLFWPSIALMASTWMVVENWVNVRKATLEVELRRLETKGKL